MCLLKCVLLSVLATVSLLVDECDDGGVGGDHDDQGQEEGEHEDEQEVQVFLGEVMRKMLTTELKVILLKGHT